MIVQTPTPQEEQDAWDRFYNVIEYHTRNFAEQYDGADYMKCLIGITDREMVKDDQDYRLIRRQWFESPELVPYDENILALAQYFHVSPDVVYDIYTSASLPYYARNLDAALEMAERKTSEARDRGQTFESWSER